MKKILYLIIILVVSSIHLTYGQDGNPYFNYQAVIRDANNDPMRNHDVAIRTSIVQGRAGDVEYTETHMATTSQLGLVNLPIGAGTPVLGDFLAIEWLQSQYSLRLEVDLDGGTNYQPAGQTDILSVPIASWARFARIADMSKGLDADYLELDALDANKIYGGTLCIDTLILNDPFLPDNGAVVLAWDEESDASYLSIAEIYSYYAEIDTLDAYKIYADDICLINSFDDVISLKPREAFMNYPSLATYLRYRVRENPLIPGTPELDMYENDRNFLNKRAGFDELFQAPYKNISLRETLSATNAKFSESRIASPFYRCLKYYALPDGPDQEVPYLDAGSFFDSGTQQHAAYSAVGLNPFQFSLTFTPFAQLLRYTYDGNVLHERNANASQLTDEGYNLSGMRMMLIDWLLGCIQAYKIETTQPNVTDGTDYVFRVVAGTDASRYERGTSQLTNGTATVELSLPFCTTVNMETMTVQLTSLSADTYGLAVIEKTPTGFVVKELGGGSGNFEFDWEVKCVVSGEENFQVVRPTVTRSRQGAEQSEIERLADKVEQITGSN